MLDLEFNLKPSNYYLSLLMVVLLTNVFIVSYLPFIFLIKLFVLGVMTTYVGYILWRYGLLKDDHSITRIRRHSDGTWSLQTRRKTYLAALCSDSTVTTLISILRFRVHSEFWPRSCVIFCDTLDTHHYHQLLVLLRTTSPSVELNVAKP